MNLTSTEVSLSHKIVMINSVLCHIINRLSYQLTITVTWNNGLIKRVTIYRVTYINNLTLPMLKVCSFKARMLCYDARSEDCEHDIESSTR